MAQLQEEVHLLRQMKEMLSKDLEESQGCSTNTLSTAGIGLQLAEKEHELNRAKEALQGLVITVFSSVTCLWSRQ